MYDDSCCPMCSPTGTCADCARYEFLQCVPFDQAGCNTNQPQACGAVAATGCQGEYNLDCLQLSKTSCEANPGCVWALKAGCTSVEGCDGLCRGVTAYACDRPCNVPAPTCPEGYAPEGSGGTYMMDCVPKAMCP